MTAPGSQAQVSQAQASHRQRSVLWLGHRYDLAWVRGEEGGTWAHGRRSHLELKRGLHLELKRRLNLELKGALAGDDRGVVVLMKLVGRSRGLADRGGRREGLVLRGLHAGTRNVSAGARALEWKRAVRVAGGDVSAWCVRCRCR